MQIHELDNYIGALDANAYFAVDNGSDTGKISGTNLFAGVEQSIEELDASLSARIDNIIAGGAAPSEAEIIDGRLGAAVLGNVSYPDIGSAIRGQITDIAKDLGIAKRTSDSKSGTTGATYGQFTLNFITPITAGSKYCLNMTMTGATLKDATVYGIISSGVYSDPLLVFTDIDKNYIFSVDANYTGFYIYVNANEKGAAYSETTTIIEIAIPSAIGDISDIKDEIEELNIDAIELASNEIEKYSSVGTSNNWSSSSTGLAVNSPITNALKLLSVEVYASTTAKAYFGLLTVSGTTATIEVVELLSLQTGNNKIYLNIDLDKTKVYYPFVRMVNGTIKFASNSAESSYFSFSASGAVAVNNTYTLTTVSGNGLYILSCELLIAAQSGNKAGVITVAKKGAEYKTISEAVAAAKLVASASNPITILIYPGVYDEVVNIGIQKYISLVGINRDTCIIRDTSGKYANSPILVNGDFLIANLTIIANHDNAGGWYPTWVVGDNTTFASYCVHTDGGQGTAQDPQYGHFLNCTFYSECSHALGLGIHPYQTICIENCRIERYVTDSNYLDDNYKGAVGCHSPVTTPLQDEADEHLVIKNSEIIFNGDKALQLYHYHIGSPMDVTAICNSLMDNNGISDLVYFRTDAKADYIAMLSHGNNTAELNYN